MSTNPVFGNLAKMFSSIQCGFHNRSSNNELFCIASKGPEAESRKCVRVTEYQYLHMGFYGQLPTDLEFYKVISKDSSTFYICHRRNEMPVIS